MSTPRVLGGRYEVGELIGRGGMADVHLGHDTRLGRKVAIKMLRSDLARDPSFLTRFRREAQSAAGLNHPMIVAIFDSGEDETTDAQGSTHTLPYIVMEYVDGHTLRQELQRVSQLSPAKAVEYTEGVLDALAYSHRMGIIHRDIKPANVMLTQSREVKVMDFGIARAVADTAATMTQTQSVVGTAQYLSPEQAQGHTVDARSDLYSTGCMLFELLTGRPPFTGDSPVAIAYQHVGELPQPPSVWNDAVGGDLDAVILHALAKDRQTRYQDAAAFRADLERVRTGRPISEAARGSGSAVGAAATQTLPAGTAIGGVPTAVHPVSGAGGENTAGLPAIGHDVTEVDDRSGGGGKAAIITIVVLAVLGLIGWGAVNWYQSQNPPAVMVSVPRLVGLTEDQAEAELAEADLRGDRAEAPDKTPEGEVFRQSPDPQTRVAARSVVRYTVSSGPESVAVPEVVGLTEAEAKQVLTNNGLTASRVVLEHDPSQDKGRVVSTVPAVGESAARGSGVELHIASGNVVVPDDLVGQDWAEVPARFADLKLRYEKTDVPSSEQAAGTIISVARAGTAVPVNTVIEVRVASAPPPEPSVTTVTATVTQSPTETTATPPPDEPTTPPPDDDNDG